MRLPRTRLRKRTLICAAMVLVIAGCQTIRDAFVVTTFAVLMIPFWPYVIVRAPIYLVNDSDTGVIETVFSPDGSHVLVTYRDNRDTTLIRLGFDGGNTEALTSGDHFDFDAAYSPDGSRIAFSRRYTQGANHLYLMDRDGSNLRQLTDLRREDFAPRFSPDGSRVVFSRYLHRKQADLFVFELDNSAETQLTSDKDTHDFGPVFLPDGDTVLFTRAEWYTAASPVGTSRWVPRGLYTIAADGGQPVQVHSYGGSSSRAESDSNVRMLLYDRQFLKLEPSAFDSMAAKGAPFLRLESVPSELRRARLQDISQDLRLMLASRTEYGTNDHIIFTYDLETHDMLDVLRFETKSIAACPKFTPDGKHILYRVRIEAEWGKKHDALWIADFEGNRQRLDTAIATVPEWTLEANDGHLSGVVVQSLVSTRREARASAR